MMSSKTFFTDDEKGEDIIIMGFSRRYLRTDMTKKLSAPYRGKRTEEDEDMGFVNCQRKSQNGSW